MVARAVTEGVERRGVGPPRSPWPGPYGADRHPPVGATFGRPPLPPPPGEVSRQAQRSRDGRGRETRSWAAEEPMAGPLRPRPASPRRGDSRIARRQRPVSGKTGGDKPRPYGADGCFPAGARPRDSPAVRSARLCGISSPTAYKCISGCWRDINWQMDETQFVAGKSSLLIFLTKFQSVCFLTKSYCI